MNGRAQVFEQQDHAALFSVLHKPVAGFQPKLRDVYVVRPARGVHDERLNAERGAQVDLFQVEICEFVVLWSGYPELAVALKRRVQVHNMQAVFLRALYIGVELFFRDKRGVGVDMYVLESGLFCQAHLLAQVHFGNGAQVNAKTFSHRYHLSYSTLLQRSSGYSVCTFNITDRRP